MKQQLQTVGGEVLQIIQPGILNTDSGPDFFNSRIKISDTIWVGNVEIHIQSSDWKSHNHQVDKNYNNVILHVVYHHDADICYENGNLIPTLELKTIISPLLLRKYRLLQSNQNTIACEKIFSVPPQTELINWIERLLVERLEEKCERFEILLNQNNNNWETAFYIFTARYFGMKTNSQPFEWLAQRLPVSVLSKHKNNRTHIEALIFGVAGFLEKNPDDAYINLLKREFDFLKTKFGLQPLDQKIWKFARTRPANFPTVRLAQFSSLIFLSSHLLSKIIHATSVGELKEFFRISQNEKLNPFRFIPHETKAKQGSFGDDAITVLLINTVLPVLFLYGKKQDKPELCERAFEFFTEINAEKNSTTRFWNSMGIQCASAFDSQALIHLKNKYCSEMKCLSCIIGKRILTDTNA